MFAAEIVNEVSETHQRSETSSSLRDLQKETFHAPIRASQWSETDPFGEEIANRRGKHFNGELFRHTSYPESILLP